MIVHRQPRQCSGSYCGSDSDRDSSSQKTVSVYHFSWSRRQLVPSQHILQQFCCFNDDCYDCFKVLTLNINLITNSAFSPLLHNTKARRWNESVKCIIILFLSIFCWWVEKYNNKLMKLTLHCNKMILDDGYYTSNWTDYFNCWHSNHGSKSCSFVLVFTSCKVTIIFTQFDIYQHILHNLLAG